MKSSIQRGPMSKRRSVQPAVKNYRMLLRRELGSRLETNSHYSMRAFARDLGMSHSALTEVLHEKKGLSSVKATEIAKRLKLPEDETALFVLMVRKEHARSALQREIAAKALKEFRRKIAAHGKPASVSKKSRSRSPLRPSTRLSTLHVNHLQADRAYQKFHRALLFEAAHSLDHATPAEQQFISAILSIPDDRIQEAKEYLIKAFEELRHFCSASGRKRKLYGVAFQLFPMGESL